MILPTALLALTPFTPDDAERVLAGDVAAHDGWEGGYAFTDEPELLAEYVRAARETGDPAPFGPYLVRRGIDGPAIGGVNLFDAGSGVVEFAFGLVPAVRGQRLSALVVDETLALIRSVGRTVARAEADVDNLPARATLEGAGLVEASRQGGVIVYEVRV